MTQGLLLLNLGTPSAPTKKAVRAYLKEFLNDPRMVTLPKWIRFILVNGWIIPFRAAKTTHAYESIWTLQGSPLLVHSLQLQQALQKKLGQNTRVSLGMRYGQPSIQTAIQELKQAGCDQITVFPLFPQYAAASTGSALEQTLQLFMKDWNIPSLHIIHDYFDHPAYVQALSLQIKDYLSQQKTKIDHILFSYHGLPVHHLEKSGCTPVCQAEACCPPIGQNNRFCYRAQCYATTAQIAKTLRLPNKQYSVSFQSRLGKTPWIQPYTDAMLKTLADKQFKNLAVVCPAFTSDCLETLEEIGLRAAEDWKKLGGESLLLVPCLNDHPAWVDAIAEICSAGTD